MTPERTTPAKDDPLRIAVVGHTNAGKTSLLRTLTRRVGFGEVSDRPGTTRHVEAADLQQEGRTAIRFLDTPGLEDAVALRAHLARRDAEDPAETPPARIRRFLAEPEAHGVFEQEAKVLRAMLDVQAAFLVIDVRESVLPKYRAEIELIAACARPVLPVLNFVRDGSGREPAWRELLAAYGLHAVVRFDAAAPFTGAETHLYRDLATLLRDHRARLERIVQALDREAQARRTSSAQRIAELLVECTAMRRLLPAADHAQPALRDRALAALRQAVNDRAQRCVSDLLALHGFREGDADEAPLPMVEGRWSLDFFEPEAMRDAGLLLGKGVAAGAAVGAVADLALAGLSLGAGAALGGAIGGAVSQGFGPLGRKLAHRLRDLRELSVEDRVLATLATWQVALARALERRGHAGVAPLDRASLEGADPVAATELAALVRALQPARSHPDWETAARLRWRESPQRAERVQLVAQRVQALLPPPVDAA